MTTLTQLIKEREETFKQHFVSDEGYVEKERDAAWSEEDITRFNQETIKLILEKVVEEIKKQKTFDDSYNEALSDLSSQLQEVIKEI